MIRIQEITKSDLIQAKEADEDDGGKRGLQMSDVHYYGQRMFIASGVEGHRRAEILQAVRKFADPKLQS